MPAQLETPIRGVSELVYGGAGLIRSGGKSASVAIGELGLFKASQAEGVNGGWKPAREVAGKPCCQS